MLLGPLRAVGFLTIVPMPGAIWRFAVPADFVLPWFPVVGLLIGLIVHCAVALVKPSALGAAVGLAVWALVTGGLHLEGLGDVLDGLARRGTPEERKAILKDPHVGSTGAAGLAAFVLLKYGALLGASWGAAIAPVAGRAAMVLSMCLFRYGRPGEPTLGASMWPRGRLAVSALTLLATGILLFPFIGAIGFRALTLSAILTISWAVLWGAFLSRAFGGITGDCCGAICETSEVACLLALLWLSQ